MMSKSLNLKKIFLTLAVCFGLFGGMLLVGCGPVDTSPELSLVNTSTVKTVYLVGEEIDYDNLVLNYYPHRNDQSDKKTIDLSKESDRAKVEITGFSTSEVTDSQTVTFTYKENSAKPKTTLTISVREADPNNFVEAGTYVFADNTTLTVDKNENQLTLRTYSSVQDYPNEPLEEFSQAMKETLYDNNYESYCAVLNGKKYFIYSNNSVIYVSSNLSENVAVNALDISFAEPLEGDFVGTQITVNYVGNKLTIYQAGQKIAEASDVEFKFDKRGVYFENASFSVIVSSNDTLKFVNAAYPNGVVCNLQP